MGTRLLFVGDAFRCGGKRSPPVGGRVPVRPRPGGHSALHVAPMDGPPQPTRIHRRKQMGPCNHHRLGHSSSLFPLSPQSPHHRPWDDSTVIHAHRDRPAEATVRHLPAAQAASCQALLDVWTVCPCHGPPLHVAQHVCRVGQQKGVYPVPHLDALSHRVHRCALCSPCLPLVHPPDLPLL